MVDLHVHLLPGIDDGPLDVSEAIEMVRIGYTSGTRCFVATPHLSAEHPRVRLEDLAGLVDALNKRLSAEGVRARVLPGAEVDPTVALTLDAEGIRLATLARRGGHVLLDTPHEGDIDVLCDAVRHLRRHGTGVLLAHVELCRALREEPSALDELLDAGALVQVTAASFEAAPGSRRLDAAHELLRRETLHVIASDGHRPHRRPPVMSAGLRAALRLEPRAAAVLAWATVDAPGAIVRGEQPPPRPSLATAGHAPGWVRRRLRRPPTDQRNAR